MVTSPMSNLVVPRKDWLALAQEQSRPRFVAGFGFPFLLAERAFEGGERPLHTEVVHSFGTLARTRQRRDPTETLLSLPTTAVTDPAPPLPLLALAKTQEHFPSMITVGRTANNDVVIPDG